MPRNYECFLVLDVTTTDEEKEGIIHKIRGLLAQNEGQIEKVEEWGKRQLAYPIKKKSEGNYLWLGLNGNPNFVKELESYFKLNDKVLRHLILIRNVSREIKIQKVKPEQLSSIPVSDQNKQTENE